MPWSQQSGMGKEESFLVDDLKEQSLVLQMPEPTNTRALAIDIFASLILRRNFDTCHANSGYKHLCPASFVQRKMELDMDMVR